MEKIGVWHESSVYGIVGISVEWTAGIAMHIMTAGCPWVALLMDEIKSVNKAWLL